MRWECGRSLGWVLGPLISLACGGQTLTSGAEGSSGSGGIGAAGFSAGGAAGSGASGGAEDCGTWNAPIEVLAQARDIEGVPSGALAVDAFSVYWATMDGIMRFDKATGKVTLVCSAVDQGELALAADLAVDETHLYWTVYGDAERC